MKYKTNSGSEVKVYKRIPKGWSVVNGTLTQPIGTVWIRNNTSTFKKGRDGKMHKNPNAKQALLVENEALMLEEMAFKRRYGEKDHFVTDKTWEAKVQTEVRKQKRLLKKIEQEKAARRNVKKPTATSTAKKSTAKKSAAKKTSRKK